MKLWSKDKSKEKVQKVLERITGKSIEFLPEDAGKIPCEETSDATKLCERPLVSVVMITYKHERYLKDAIDGVLMQQTDFDYELLIGNDASPDRTREICLDYQRRYPEKVRVLWAAENVKVGANIRRCHARCRGDYIAYCEGDDFWTDPRKLQKQIDAIRRTDAVACVAFSNWHYPDGRDVPSLYEATPFVTGEDFSRHYFQTATLVAQRSAVSKVESLTHELPLLYSTIEMMGLQSLGPVCLVPEIMSTYRITGEGVASGRDQLGLALLGIESAWQMIYLGLSGCPVSFYARNLQNKIRSLFSSGDEATALYLKGRVGFYVYLYCWAQKRIIIDLIKSAFARHRDFLKSVLAYKRI